MFVDGSSGIISRGFCLFCYFEMLMEINYIANRELVLR